MGQNRKGIPKGERGPCVNEKQGEKNTRHKMSVS